MRATLSLAMAAAILISGVSCTCTGDPSASKPAPGPDGPYEIGDCYDHEGIRGIVYKVTDDGMHGMLVSLDEHTGLAWSEIVADTGAADLYDGRKNGERIRAIEEWYKYYPAFKWCADHNKKGDDGWYLPAYMELKELYAGFNGGETRKNKTARDEFNRRLRDNRGTIITEAYYWSSSENGESRAYIERFSDGGYSFDYYNDKPTVYRVRAVRAF